MTVNKGRFSVESCLLEEFSGEADISGISMERKIASQTNRNFTTLAAKVMMADGRVGVIVDMDKEGL